MDPATLTKVEVAPASTDPATFIKVEVAHSKRKRPLISSNLRCPKEDVHETSKKGRMLSTPLLLSDLVSCFHLSLNEAAGHLGVSTSALKKKARRLVFYPPPPHTHTLSSFTFVPHCSLSPSSLHTVLIFSCIGIAPNQTSVKGIPKWPHRQIQKYIVRDLLLQIRRPLPLLPPIS
jgi:hypothetical protein